MKNKEQKRWYQLLAAFTAAGMFLTGCGNAVTGSGKEGTQTQAAGNTINTESIESGAGKAGEVTILDVTDLFTNRDREVGYDESECVKIELTGTSAQSESGNVKIENDTVRITEEGSYLISGKLQGQIVIDAESSDKIQLILDGAEISCGNSAALYVKQADKVFVTTASGSNNLLETTGGYVAIDDNNIDGAVFAKDDITFNGEGSLTVKSPSGNGIVGKDDLVITSGDYEISAGNHGLQGKDSVRIANGNLVINAGEDGIHSGNDEDETVGYTYIAGGSLTLTVGDDGIHSDTQLVIAGGSLNITQSYEGLEGMEIEITDGEISVVSRDDGLNAAGGNDGSGTQNTNSGKGGFGEDPFAANGKNQIIISGGVLKVNAEGDGIDSNGNLYINGGEILVYGPSNGGNGALDFGGGGYIYGGSVIAMGSGQMAVNFASDSGQCAIMVNAQSVQAAGTKVILQDAAGNVLLSTVSEKSFDNVVFSFDQILVGETYTVVIGEETTEIEMSETIYGAGSGMGGHGGMGGRGGKGEFTNPGDFGNKEGFGNKEERDQMRRPMDGEKPEQTPEQIPGQMPENAFPSM